MGGWGSNRWRGYVKKPAAEDCAVLSTTILVRSPMGRALAERRAGHGTFQWNDEAAVPYELRPADGSMILRVDGILLLRMVSTPCTYGGIRWWLECPKCKRRVLKLYMPTRGRVFACRDCHQISYRSSQQAHVDEHIPGPLGPALRKKAIAKRVERLLMKHDRARSARRKAYFWGLVEKNLRRLALDLGK